LNCHKIVDSLVIMNIGEFIVDQISEELGVKNLDKIMIVGNSLRPKLLCWGRTLGNKIN
jgi:hypothetical protein